MGEIEIIGLGALNIDHIYKVERILEDGESVADEAKSFPGGSAANTIYGLAKLGVITGFAGVVGGDTEGKLLIQDFEKVGVDTCQIMIKEGEKTGSTLCLVDSSGNRSIYVTTGANNSLTLDDLDLAYINQANLLHISSFADERQFKVILELINKLAPSVRVSFSPGELYAKNGLKALDPILGRTYVLFINQSEIQNLTGKDSIAGAKICLEHGCHIVVVTLGKGKKLTGNEKTTTICYIRDAKNEYLVESTSRAEIPALDTTGAGDAFATGFLYGLLNGKELDECGRLGDIVAKFCISQLGARQGLPTTTQLVKHYGELYNQTL
jgi:ribokinase